ncbi:MAG: MoxR family ATPase [Planctomycetes bacterium]|nr:MoxR family ATPase [Planctomycetota bacterium]
MDAEQLKEVIKSFKKDFDDMRNEVAKMIVGNEDQIEKVIIALVAGGNVLLEGVPGLGKTVLVQTLSEVLHLDFRRIQFTPDLMPADIVGTNALGEDEKGRMTMTFQPGPVFTNMLLVDEINRATSRTQSALLEAMEEHTVTVGGVTHELSEPFFIMATQNPVEQSGTYPLPTAQLDKFMFKLLVDYPTGDELDEIINRTTNQAPPELNAITSKEQILTMREISRRVPVAEHVEKYASLLTLATHPDMEYGNDRLRSLITTGASPRAMLSLLASARVRALICGRYQVSTDDVKSMAISVFRHRIVKSFEAENEDITEDDIVQMLLDHVDPTNLDAFENTQTAQTEGAVTQ